MKLNDSPVLKKTFEGFDSSVCTISNDHTDDDESGLHSL